MPERNGRLVASVVIVRAIRCGGLAHMSERALAAFKRFSNNMKRIDRLTKLLFGDLGAKPTSFMVYEGVSADIFRMIVVFSPRNAGGSCQKFAPT
jgi:hypothetical protein